MAYMQTGEYNYLGILERVLKLSVPNLAIWLLLFFMFFHSFLNLTAELCRFGDRQFYKGWCVCGWVWVCICICAFCQCVAVCELPRKGTLHVSSRHVCLPDALRVGSW